MHICLLGGLSGSFPYLKEMSLCSRKVTGLRTGMYIYIFIGTYSVCRGVKAQDVGWSWWILIGHRFWMNNQVSDSRIVKTLFVWWQVFFSKLSLFSLKDTPSCLSFWRLKILSAFLYNLYFAMYVTFKEIILQMYIVFSITTVISHNESKYVSWREGSSCVCEVLKSLTVKFPLKFDGITSKYKMSIFKAFLVTVFFNIYPLWR